MLASIDALNRLQRAYAHAILWHAGKYIHVSSTPASMLATATSPHVLGIYRVRL